MTINISIRKVVTGGYMVSYPKNGYNPLHKIPKQTIYSIAVDGVRVDTALTKRRANRIAWRLKKEYDKKHNKAVLENAAPD